MRNADDAPVVPEPSAIGQYRFVCWVSLLVMLLGLLPGGLGPIYLLPVVVGGLGIVARWRSAPTLLLIAVGGILYVQSAMLVRGQPSRLQATWSADEVITYLIVGGAVLAYTAAHYRFQSLVLNVLPPDPRLRKGGEPRRRSPRLVSGGEMPFLLVSVGVLTGLAGVVWVAQLTLAGEWYARPWPPGGFEALGMMLLRVRPLAWLVGTVALVAATVLGHLGWRRLGQAEARGFLQDQVWQETRREQGRIQRWRVWARRRQQRKEGKV
jgi:hypothetical protein